MTTLVVDGGRPLRGRVRVPGDKSISHRALLLGARAEGTSVVRGLSQGDDVAHTAAAVRCLGAAIEGERIAGGKSRLVECEAPIDVGNSGTTMRLLAGFCAPFPWLTVLVGDESIGRRPMDRVAQPLRQMGAVVTGRAEACLPPLIVRGGRLQGIDYQPPVASAQVKGAVLLAGLDAAGGTVVREPVRTRAHTEEMLAACGADVEASLDGRTVRVRPSELEPFELDVPGDPSQAAFWVVAACIIPGSDLVVEGVYLGPGRDGFVEVLRRMGAHVEAEPVGRSTANVHARFGALGGTEIAGEEVPGVIDEIPALAVAAAVAEGVTTVRGASELRIKETDRIAAMASELAALGARVEAMPDGLVIAGGGRLRGAPVRSHGDHRTAMALAVAGLSAAGSTRIDGWDAVDTSYPGFEQDLRSLL